MSTPHVEVVDCTMSVTWPPPPRPAFRPDPDWPLRTSSPTHAPVSWVVSQLGLPLGVTACPQIAQHYRDTGRTVEEA